MRKALVTGANGFVGSVLVRRLLRDGIEVRAMCRVPEKGKALANEGAQIVRGDVQDGPSLEHHVQGCDTVFHLAAVGDGTASYQYNVNVQGTRTLAEVAQRAQVERFVHVSSVAVYGVEIDGPIRESHPPGRNRDYFYGQTKALGENDLWAYAKQTGLPVVSVRPAFVYGAGSPFWSGQIYQLCRRSMMPLVDKGRGNAHPIYVEDLADLLVTAATHPGASGYAFHAAPDPAPSWREYLSHFMRIAGLPLDSAVIHLTPETVSLLTIPAQTLSMLTRLIGQPRDIIGLLNYMGSRTTYLMDEAVQRLDWRPKFSLEQGMTLTEPWLRSLDQRSALN